MSLELVHVETSDGVRLDGVWRKPDAPGKSRFPVDAMILHHGVAENFYGSSPHDSFAPWLVENGCAAIRVNNRGHGISLQLLNHIRQHLELRAEIA